MPTTRAPGVPFWTQVRSNLIAQVVGIAAGGVVAVVVSISSFGMFWLDTRFDPLTNGIKLLNEKIERLEGVNISQQRQIDDHESRMQRGREDRLEFQKETKEQLDLLDGKLDSVKTQIGDVNATLAALETLLTNRLPASRNRADSGEPWKQRQ